MWDSLEQKSGTRAPCLPPLSARSCGIQRFHTGLDCHRIRPSSIKDAPQLFRRSKIGSSAHGWEQLFAMLHPGTTAFVASHRPTMRIEEQGPLLILHFDQLALFSTTMTRCFQSPSAQEWKSPSYPVGERSDRFLVEVLRPRTLGFVFVSMLKQAHKAWITIQPVLLTRRARLPIFGPALAPHLRLSIFLVGHGWNASAAFYRFISQSSAGLFLQVAGA